jgi:hypothetical protein
MDSGRDLAPVERLIEYMLGCLRRFRGGRRAAYSSDCNKSPTEVRRLASRDREIRETLKGWLAHRHERDSTTLFVDEFDICGLTRVDVAVINHCLSGFELKSDSDTLRRLPQQIAVYGLVLDEVTLVVGERLFPDAIEMVPHSWGVMVASSQSGNVVLDVHRNAEWNSDISAIAVAQLLWREEVLAELVARGIDRGMHSKARRYLWERLAEMAPPSDLRALVRQRLKSRKGWRAQSERELSDA